MNVNNVNILLVLKTLSLSIQTSAKKTFDNVIYNTELKVNTTVLLNRKVPAYAVKNALSDRPCIQVFSETENLGDAGIVEAQILLTLNPGVVAFFIPFTIGKVNGSETLDGEALPESGKTRIKPHSVPDYYTAGYRGYCPPVSAPLGYSVGRKRLLSTAEGASRGSMFFFLYIRRSTLVGVHASACGGHNTLKRVLQRYVLQRYVSQRYVLQLFKYRGNYG